MLGAAMPAALPPAPPSGVRLRITHITTSIVSITGFIITTISRDCQTSAKKGSLSVLTDQVQ